MIYIKLLQGERLQRFINIIKTFKSFNDYVNFIFDNDKLYVQGMDNSHICLYELSIQKNWFDEYNFKIEDENDTIILSCVSNILNKIIGLCKSNEGISIQSTDNEKIQINIFENNNLETGKIFEIPCVNIDVTNLQSYEIDYDFKLTINSKELSNIINELTLFGNELQILTHKDMIKFKTETNEGSMSQKKKISQFIENDCNINQNIYCKYQINYLNNMLSLHKVFSMTKFSFQNDVPLCMYFHEENEENEPLLKLKFYLAPKFHENEDVIENIVFDEEF